MYGETRDLVEFFSLLHLVSDYFQRNKIGVSCDLFSDKARQNKQITILVRIVQLTLTITLYKLMILLGSNQLQRKKL